MRLWWGRKSRGDDGGDDYDEGGMESRWKNPRCIGLIGVTRCLLRAVAARGDMHPLILSVNSVNTVNMSSPIPGRAKWGKSESLDFYGPPLFIGFLSSSSAFRLTTCLSTGPNSPVILALRF